MSFSYENTVRSIETGRANPDYGRVLRVITPQLVKMRYEAAKETRFRRTRDSLGGTADAHYRSSLDFWRMREFARDFDRSDAIVGQMVDRAVNNVVGPGLRVAPQTGDKELNTKLAQEFHAWADKARTFDVSRRENFGQMQGLALRHEIIDGDCFGLLGPRSATDRVGLFEGDRVDGGALSEDHVVHGVELDTETDEPIAYYFVKKQPRKISRVSRPLATSNSTLQRVPAESAMGQEQVLHLFDPKRRTQTRGVTAFRAIFNMLSMVEDINFAKLVQCQLVSCIAMFIERERDFAWGGRTEEDDGSGNTLTLEKMAPGMIGRLKKGEKVSGFSPSVPNPEYLPFLRIILRIIGCNIGMPLELVLLDTTDTTFHGYRGALQQARKGFTSMQDRIVARFCSPVYEWWLARAHPNIIPLHSWRRPGWPYVDPLKDSQADQVKLEHALSSPDRVAMERHGLPFRELADEMVDGWTYLVEKAADEAVRLNKKFKETPEVGAITWRDCCNLAVPAGVSNKGNNPRVMEGEGSGGGGGGKDQERDEDGKFL